MYRVSTSGSSTYRVSTYVQALVKKQMGIIHKKKSLLNIWSFLFLSLPAYLFMTFRFSPFLCLYVSSFFLSSTAIVEAWARVATLPFSIGASSSRHKCVVPFSWSLLCHWKVLLTRATLNHRRSGSITHPLGQKLRFFEETSNETNLTWRFSNLKLFPLPCETINETRGHLLIQTRKQVFLIHFIVIVLYRCCTTCKEQRSCWNNIRGFTFGDKKLLRITQTGRF